MTRGMTPGSPCQRSSKCSGGCPRRKNCQQHDGDCRRRSKKHDWCWKLDPSFRVDSNKNLSALLLKRQGKEFCSLVWYSLELFTMVDGLRELRCINTSLEKNSCGCQRKFRIPSKKGTSRTQRFCLSVSFLLFCSTLILRYLHRSIYEPRWYPRLLL